MGEINGVGRLRSDIFTVLAGCYAQTRVESICREQSGNMFPQNLVLELAVKFIEAVVRETSL